MKDKKNGFTLIELLAIIVILAIIAVIAVPKILDVIDGVKRDSIKSSARGYVDAVKKQIAVSMLDDDASNDIVDGVYTVADLEQKGVRVDGNKPNPDGSVTVSGRNVTDYSLSFGDYDVALSDGNMSISKDGGEEVITPDEPGNINLDGINITFADVTVGVGSVVQKTANVDSGNIIYTSVNPEIATVSDSGVITGVSAGHTRIIAQPEDNMSRYALLDVNVVDTTIVFSETTINLGLNRSISMPATVGEGSITYTSSDSSVATVDVDGNITALKKGNAVISAMSNYANGRVATLSVNVDYYPGSIVYFNPVTGLKCDSSNYSSSYSVLGYNSSACMKWYALVLNDGTTLDLLLDHSLSTKIAWYSSNTNNSDYGPVAAFSSLKSTTAGWNGVPTRSDSFVGPTYSGGTYTVDYTGSKARFLTGGEVATISNVTWTPKTPGAITVPGWLDDTYQPYWLADNYIYYNNLFGMCIHRTIMKALAAGNVGGDSAAYLNVGARPVITISKSILQ